MGANHYQVPIHFYINTVDEEAAKTFANWIADLVYKSYGFDSDIGKVEERA